MTDMNQVNASIRAALSSDQPSDFLLEFDEPPLLVQAAQIFRGRNRWINIIMVMVSVCCVGLSGYAVYQFYLAVEMKPLIAWALTFVVGFLAVSIMKIWAWLEMEKYSTIREVKRLELQVVALREQIQKYQAAN